jgi:hypothetical protein
MGRSKIEVGNIVRYANPRQFFHGAKAEKRKNKITGLVVEVKGVQWVRVQWTDGVVYDEHANDLEIVNGSRHDTV